MLAIPREIPSEHHADLIRDYCREFFVSKGMIADFAIHDTRAMPGLPGICNPHAHILLTMRAMDEKGKWLPKSRKVYDLDGNGERIRLPSGRRTADCLNPMIKLYGGSDLWYDNSASLALLL